MYLLLFHALGKDTASTTVYSTAKSCTVVPSATELVCAVAGSDNGVAMACTYRQYSLHTSLLKFKKTGYDVTPIIF